VNCDPTPQQRAAAERLERLQRELEAPPAASGLLGKPAWPQAGVAPRGLYMWGGVGRGKSMLMDLFHEALAIPEKRRTHFHAFMLEVHARLRESAARARPAILFRPSPQPWPRACVCSRSTRWSSTTAPMP
jgi:predicted ATPase